MINTEGLTYLFLVMALLAVVDTVLIAVQLHLEPGDKYPMKHHSVVIDRCNQFQCRKTGAKLTTVRCCRGHTNLRPHLSQEAPRSLGRTAI